MFHIVELRVGHKREKKRISLQFSQGCQLGQNGGQLLSKLVAVLAAPKTEDTQIVIKDMYQTQ